MLPSLIEIETLVRRAGEIIRSGYNPRPGFGEELQVEFKGRIDLVTEIDRRSEDFLISEIRRRYPGDRIVTEESGELSGSSCCVWFIDPLDGTTNFAHGLPVFSVSVAYSENGQVYFGAAYDPLRDECFSARVGGGAWLNGDLIRVSKARELDKCLLVTGFAYDQYNLEANFEPFKQFCLKALSVRRIGSAVLDLCYVAAGRLDGYWELKNYPWDLAAAGLIAREAGARVTNVSGDEDYLQEPCSIVAANEIIHPQMLKILEELRASEEHTDQA